MSTASGKYALAAPSDDEPAPKHVRINHDRNWWMPVLSPLSDKGSWCILEQFLTTEMTYPQMEEALLSHLSPQYSADDWKDTRDALFSGDGNDNIALPFILDEAEEGDDEDKDKDKEGDGDHQACGSLFDDETGSEDGIMRLQNATCLTGPLAKDTLAVAIDKIFVKFGEKASVLRKDAFLTGLLGSLTQVKVGRTATPYITEHLSSKGFSVIVSAWVPDGEFGVVKRSNLKLPNPLWVRIKHGKYKGDISYVFDSEQLTGFVVVLIPPQEFPYSMPHGSKALLN
ncbi:hypothetical protein BDR06DRAFT_972662 [Suillus hirtellus]|nr:hypothetical protein BDR06DRAFT_972662 [Suillus hirtellus]